MEKWTNAYGGKIYSGIAFAYAHLGDMTKAKHFVALHKEFLGEFGEMDADE